MGASLGAIVGVLVGDAVGWLVGMADGWLDGEGVGCGATSRSSSTRLSGSGSLLRSLTRSGVSRAWRATVVVASAMRNV